METTKSTPTTVRWQSVALPTEHGGWSFIIEPVLCGLLLAPGLGGLAISIAAFGAFLMRQPLKIYAKDIRNQRQNSRTLVARRYLWIYGIITVLAGISALLLMPSPAVLIPLLVALPLLGLQLTHDFRNQSRQALAEVAGAMATGAIASSIVLMSGWSMLAAFGVWLALAVKAITAVLYVRSRLRLERGQPAALPLALGAHAAALLVLAISSIVGITSWTAPLAMAILIARAAVGLSPWRARHAAKVIGAQEMVYGLVYLLIIALGYAVRLPVQ